MSLEMQDDSTKQDKEKKDAYLAHRLSKRFKVRDEIQPLLEKAFPNFNFRNPFMEHGKYVYETESSLEEDVSKTYEGDKTPWDIVEDDIGLLEECDVLVAYIDGGLNVGTPSEIFYNSYVLGRQTILVFNETNEKSADLMHHPWLLALADEDVYTMSMVKKIAGYNTGYLPE